MNSKLTSKPNPNVVSAFEVCVSIFDGTHDSPKRKESGFRLVTSRHIKGNEVLKDEAYFVAEEDYLKITKRSGLEVDDVLFTMIGTVGEVCRVKSTPDFAIKNIGVFRPKEKSDSLWLYYFLISPEGKKSIEASKRGTTQQFMGLKELRNFPINFPGDANYRRLQVEVLDLLDSKIAKSNEIAQTLEKIAEAIFKSWFIDFEPVKAKMSGKKPVGMDDATAALFPALMEDSELGPIPNGWDVRKLGDLCNTTIGGLWGKDAESKDSPTPYACIRGVDMDDLKANGYAGRVPTRWDKTQNYEKRLLNSRHILIAGSGAGPVGKSLLWDESMNRLFAKPVIFSNFVKRFECKQPEDASYVSGVLTNMYSTREIFIYVNGTSVPNLQDGELLSSKQVVVPAPQILQLFDALLRDIIRLKFNGMSQSLVEIRDQLLPRLISGELQIPEEMLVRNGCI